MADDRKNSDFYKNPLLLVLTGLTATKWNVLSDLTTWLVVDGRLAKSTVGPSD